MRGAYAHVLSADMDPMEAFADDKLMRDGFKAGSKRLADAMESGTGPSDLIWLHHSGGADYSQPRYPEALARAEERDAKAEKLRVSRDPCPKCGVRGDVGCKHNRKNRSIHEYLTKPKLIDEAWDRELMLARRGWA